MKTISENTKRRISSIMGGVDYNIRPCIAFDILTVIEDDVRHIIWRELVDNIASPINISLNI